MKKALFNPLARMGVAVLLLMTLLLALPACVYKYDIQQGNLISHEKVDQLKTGMTKRQVRYLLGTPLVMDTFNQNRWDYLYTLRYYRPGDSDGKFSQERLTLYFENDQLSRIDNHLSDKVVWPAQTHRSQKEIEEKQSKPDGSDTNHPADAQ